MNRWCVRYWKWVKVIVFCVLWNHVQSLIVLIFYNATHRRQQLSNDYSEFNTKSHFSCIVANVHIRDRWDIRKPIAKFSDYYYCYCYYLIRGEYLCCVYSVFKRCTLVFMHWTWTLNMLLNLTLVLIGYGALYTKCNLYNVYSTVYNGYIHRLDIIILKFIHRKP